jgi:predicted transglutaminase-like cysteine proteinase
MKLSLLNIALASALAIAPAAVQAQATASAPQTTPTPGQHDHDINQRKADQQSRIAQGDKRGQLTPGETRHLENQEHGINKEEKGMRAQDNGHLTKQDRQTLHKQQNQESRRIYRDKHNDKVN